MRRPRWFEFIPEAVLALGLGLFALTEPHAAASGLKSPRAIVLMGTVAVGWVLARLVMLKAVPWPVLRAVPFAVGALVILKIVVLPAYDNKTVIETLSTRSVPAAEVVTTTTSAAPTTTPPAAPPTTSPAAPTATAPAAPPTTSPAAPDPTPAVPPTTMIPTAAEPMRFRTGMLQGIDHRASGTVTLYRQPDASVVVGLEDFDIQPGPAYALYVVPGSDRQDHDGGTRLSKLRGNRGTQYYDVPADVAIDGDAWTVLVWCETFDVPVANATPAAV